MRRWSDEHSAQLSEAARLAGGAPRDEVAGLLYQHWYAAPVSEEVLDPLWPPLTGLLRCAHAGADRWVDGGEVVRTGLSGVVVSRASGQVPRARVRAEYTRSDPDGAGRSASSGSRVLVLDRLTSHEADGWWRTWGGGWDSRALPTRLSRVYLATRATTVAPLVHDVTEVVLPVGAPWLLKVGLATETLARPDGAVLYLPDAMVPVLARRVAEAAAAWVGETVPPLTCRLGPGVAWAQDPGDGGSFGESRCALVADGLARASARDGGPRHTELVLEAVAASFAAAGIDPGTPHLRPRQEGEGT